MFLNNLNRKVLWAKEIKELVTFKNFTKAKIIFNPYPHF